MKAEEIKLLKELFDEKLNGLNIKMDNLIDLNEWQSGKIGNNSAKIQGIKDDIKELQDYNKDMDKNPVIKQIKKRPIQLIFGAALQFLIVVGVISVDQLIGLKKYKFW
jgi:hypothetical protein